LIEEASIAKGIRRISGITGDMASQSVAWQETLSSKFQELKLRLNKDVLSSEEISKTLSELEKFRFVGFNALFRSI
jgi:alanyl-tRNA synthetase